MIEFLKNMLHGTNIIFSGKQTSLPPRTQKAPIIIGGFYRSGTSLLRRILDAHDNINCPPEIKFFKDFYGHYKNDELAHVRFFKTARSMGIHEKELLSFWGENFTKLHELAARKRGKQRWADKNPENLLYLKQWHKLLKGQMTFIYVVRNPLDCLSSLNEVGFKKEMPEEFELKVDLFKSFTDKGIKFIQENEEISYVVRYEDLVTNPESELQNLFAFIGEDYQHSVLDTFNSRKRISGIEDPKIMTSKKIHTSSIGRWKKDLNTYQSHYIIKRCNSFARKFNYNF